MRKLLLIIAMVLVIAGCQPPDGKGNQGPKFSERHSHLLEIEFRGIPSGERPTKSPDLDPQNSDLLSRMKEAGATPDN